MPDNAREAYEMAQRRKLPKSTLVSLIREIARDRIFDESRSVRELLIQFFESATSKQKDELLRNLGSYPGDKYLKGITSR
jgi:hypothetical protein